MLKLETKQLLGGVESLTKIEGVYYRNLEGNMPNTSDLVTILRDVQTKCDLIKLGTTIEAINDLLASIEFFKNRWQSNEFPNSEAVKQLGIIRATLKNELESRKVLILDTGKATYYNQPKLFGGDVYAHFPAFREDIECAGNCLATGNFTACVMHLARVVEGSLRTYAKFLEVTFTLHWETLATRTRTEMQLRTSANSWQPHQLAFCRRVQGSLESANTAWRNDYMHPGPSYDEPKALRIYNAVKGLMQDLAEHLNEKGKFVIQRKKKK